MLWVGEFPGSDATDAVRREARTLTMGCYISFFWEQQSLRPCILRKPPFCGLGLMGGLAELRNEIFAFCNMLECVEILTYPPN